LQRSAAQDVHVKMRHAFAAIRTIINHEPKARIVQAFLPGDPLCDIEEMAQKRFVRCRGFRHAGDFSFGNDEKMNRRLGIHIVKRQAKVVFISDPGRDFAGDDLRENGAHILMN